VLLRQLLRQLRCGAVQLRPGSVADRLKGGHVVTLQRQRSRLAGRGRQHVGAAD
jgi:hypothetical protein